MPKPVNHSKLDAAIRSALKSFTAKPEERVPFEDIEPHIQQKPRKHPFKEFAFSMNSFIGAISLSSFFNKEAFFAFTKKWAVTAYIAVGTAAVGTGGYFLIDSFTYQNNLSSADNTSKATATHLSKGRFSLANEIAGNMLMLFKNTPNIIQSVTTVTGQVSNPSQYIPQTASASLQQSANLLAETVDPSSTGKSASVTIDAITPTTNEGANEATTGEAIQLKLANEGDAKTETFDFSSTPDTGDNTLLKTEKAATEDSALTEEENVAAENAAVETKKKDTKAVVKTKKRKRTFFSKSAFQH